MQSELGKGSPPALPRSLVHADGRLCGTGQGDVQGVTEGRPISYVFG